MKILETINKPDEIDLRDMMDIFDRIKGKDYETDFIYTKDNEIWLVVYIGKTPSTNDLEKHLKI